jgi:hypothetical protein
VAVGKSLARAVVVGADPQLPGRFPGHARDGLAGCAAEVHAHHLCAGAGDAARAEEVVVKGQPQRQGPGARPDVLAYLGFAAPYAVDGLNTVLGKPGTFAVLAGLTSARAARVRATAGASGYRTDAAYSPPSPSSAAGEPAGRATRSTHA